MFRILWPPATYIKTALLKNQYNDRESINFYCFTNVVNYGQHNDVS